MASERAIQMHLDVYLYFVDYGKAFVKSWLKYMLELLDLFAKNIRKIQANCLQTSDQGPMLKTPDFDTEIRL